MTKRWHQLKLALRQGDELDYAKCGGNQLSEVEMAKKGPKPCLRVRWNGSAYEMTLFESRQGALNNVARWEEPDVAAFQASGELVRRLEEVRDRRAGREK